MITPDPRQRHMSGHSFAFCTGPTSTAKILPGSFRGHPAGAWRTCRRGSRGKIFRRAIDAIDVTTPSGMRDRALLLLLATTGLRNKELRALELQDIRWRTAKSLCGEPRGSATGSCRS